MGNKNILPKAPTGKSLLQIKDIQQEMDISIGGNCSIEESVIIGRHVVIGNNVIIESGVCICDGVQIEDDCHIAAGVVFTMDADQENAPPRIIVSSNTYIGANSTICQVAIGRNSVVKPGTVVTRKIPSNAIVCGNPAKITGYRDTDIIAHKKHPIYTKEAPYASKTGAHIYNLPEFSDMRGDLSVIEIEELLPFPINRIFYTYNIDTELVRGEHAHIQCQQFLISVAGSVNVLCDNGQHREEFVLDNPGVGLHIPHLCWGVQYKHSKDNILVVLASHSYEAGDYIRDYDAFLQYIAPAS